MAVRRYSGWTHIAALPCAYLLALYGYSFASSHSNGPSRTLRSFAPAIHLCYRSSHPSLFLLRITCFVALVPSSSSPFGSIIIVVSSRSPAVGYSHRVESGLHHCAHLLPHQQLVILYHHTYVITQHGLNSRLRFRSGVLLSDDHQPRLRD